MKIYLKNNWSEQFIYGEKSSSGYFVGREQEIRGLNNVLSNNDSSSILVSSIRGVGKTSFVHRALDELRKEEDNIFPIFVNMGHTLSNTEIKNNKRNILASLIRAIFLDEIFLKSLKKNEKDNLEDLYKKATGTYFLANNEDKKIIKESSFKYNLNIKTSDVYKILSMFFSSIFGFIGVYNNNWITVLAGGIPMLFAFGYSNVSRHIYKKNNIQENRVDDTTEYIEIEFEKWLKNQKEKSFRKKGNNIIFVIDELDKIEESTALNLIQEFKNLFTRSFTHFIFISSQETYNLTQNGRENSIEDGGGFPTFFTNIFYLSLPKTDEIKRYLKEIFYSKDKKDNEYVKENTKELVNYLLFRSGNDFFELKKIISNIIHIGNDKKVYIDINLLKKEDLEFHEKSDLFKRINLWFVKRKWSLLKENWKKNSDMQKEVFNFLNKNYPKSFFSIDIKTEVEKSLVAHLIRIGLYEKIDYDVDDHGEVIPVPENIYVCTNSYNRNPNADLTEEDEKLKKIFTELIDTANELDDLPKAYNDKSNFTDHKSVEEGCDGEKFSGVSLYSIYKKYKTLNFKISEPFSRLSVREEQVKEANKIIKEQIENIKKKYFSILLELTSEILGDDIVDRETISSNPALFNTLNNFQSNFTPIKNRIFRKVDNSKIVLLVNNFKDFDLIEEGISKLRDRNDILIINIEKGKIYKRDFQRIGIDRAGKKRKKKIIVDNFINIQVSSIRELANIMTDVKNHLS